MSNFSQFIDVIANTALDEILMVFFDVVLLFTAIPVEKVCECLRIKLESDVTLPSRTKLTIDDVISLLRFALTSIASLTCNNTHL